MLHSERTQGFTADPDYWKGEVFVYVGSIQNLKDLKDVQDAVMALVVREGCTNISVLVLVVQPTFASHAHLSLRK